MGDVVRAFLRRKRLQRCCNDGLQPVYSPRCGLPQQRLQLGKDLLNRIAIWRIGRQEYQRGPRLTDDFAAPLDLMGGQIIEHDNGARPQRGAEQGGRIRPEGRAVHGAVGGPWGRGVPPAAIRRPARWSANGRAESRPGSAARAARGRGAGPAWSWRQSHQGRRVWLGRGTAGERSRPCAAPLRLRAPVPGHARSFFEREPMAAGEGVDGTERETLPPLGEQTVAEFGEGAVRRLLDRARSRAAWASMRWERRSPPHGLARVRPVCR